MAHLATSCDKVVVSPMPKYRIGKKQGHLMSKYGVAQQVTELADFAQPISMYSYSHALLRLCHAYGETIITLQKALYTEVLHESARSQHWRRWYR